MYRVLVSWHTCCDNFYCKEPPQEFYAIHAHEAWELWYRITTMGFKHIKVYNKFGNECNPSKGYRDM